MNQPTYTQDELDRLVMVERGLIADAIREAINTHGNCPTVRQAVYLMAKAMFPNHFKEAMSMVYIESPREARQVFAWYEACGLGEGA